MKNDKSHLQESAIFGLWKFFLQVKPSFCTKFKLIFIHAISKHLEQQNGVSSGLADSKRLVVSPPCGNCM